MSVDLKALILFVVVILSLLQGLTTFLFMGRKNNSRTRWLFLLEIMISATWALSIAMFLLTNSAENATWLAKTFYIMAVFLAWVWLPLSYSLRDDSSENPHPKLFAVGVLTLIPCVILSMGIAFDITPVINDITIGVDGNSAMPADYYLLFAVYFCAYCLGALVVLIKNWLLARSSMGRASCSGIIIVYTVALIFGALFNLALPYFGDYSLIWVGPFNIMILSTYIVAIRHGLFNVKSTIIRILAWLGVIAVAAVVYWSIVEMARMVGINTNDTAVEMIIFVSVLIMLYPVVRGILKTSQRSSGSRLLDRDFLSSVSQSAIKSNDINVILNDIAYTIGQQLNCKVVIDAPADYISDNDDTPRLYAGQPPNISEKGWKTLRDFMEMCHETVIMIDKLPNMGRVMGLLKSHNVSVVIKANSNSDNMIYLLLWDMDVKLYSERELKVLRSVSEVLSMVFTNAYQFQQIKNFNQDLQRKLEDATAGLKRSNEHLMKLDKTKDEFLSLASHQLRTPLTSIKGYLSMLLDGDFGELTPKQRTAVDDAYNSSQQMVTTIGDFLDVSRIQTNHFVVHKAPTNLAEILTTQIDQLKNTAKTRDITIISEIEPKMPMIDLDGEKISQVMMNFIDNAIYYSPKGSSVTISLYIQGRRVVFAVRDNGMGVPDADKHNLFTKFYRAENAKNARPNGTGVGLYVARKVIVAHGGQIIFSSKIGKGSTFGFKIPIKS